MSNLPGNPHAYNAEYGMNGTILSSDDSGTQTIEALLMDNARATLALAYEQRTANLLKVLELQGRMQAAQQAFNLSAFDVAERLGLEAGE